MEPEINNNQKMMLMNQIRSLAFAVNDLSLYLDTHPCDAKALKCHNDYAEELHNLKMIYQKEYGPLSIFNTDQSWKWIESPWPWEKGGV